MHDEDRDPPDRPDADRPAPTGLTGLFERLVAVMVGLWAALIVGVFGALFEGLRRALGGSPHEPDGADAADDERDR
ncbi:MAG: hypothetical protein H6733_15470 [Alphaproteobacteria bacterium]|nr:hypothetical protein [Alphaproteobacteria bacterium]